MASESAVVPRLAIGTLVLSGAAQNWRFATGGMMGLNYQSGENLRNGDRVRYGGNAGTIELVVDGLTGDSETDWLFENHGVGILVVEPTVFGRLYLSAPHDEKDLVFVARVGEP
jgi:hypothetical protein